MGDVWGMRWQHVLGGRLAWAARTGTGLGCRGGSMEGWGRMVRGLTEEEDAAAEDDHQGTEGDTGPSSGSSQDTILTGAVPAAVTHREVQQLLPLPRGGPRVPQKQRERVEPLGQLRQHGQHCMGHCGGTGVSGVPPMQQPHLRQPSPLKRVMLQLRASWGCWGLSWKWKGAPWGGRSSSVAPSSKFPPRPGRPQSTPASGCSSGAWSLTSRISMESVPVAESGGSAGGTERGFSRGQRRGRTC